MRLKEKPEPLGERGRAKKRKGQYFYRHHLNTTQKNFKSKCHWSRHPEQRRKDVELLALSGLDFREDCGFARLVKIGGQNDR